MSNKKEIEITANQEYKYGFTIDVESDVMPRGLDEKTIESISKRKEEPKWMLEKRLSAYKIWLKMREPNWANFKYPNIDYQSIRYYAAPKRKLKDLSEVDPEILRAYKKLGISLEEQKWLAGVETAKESNINQEQIDKYNENNTNREQIDKYSENSTDQENIFKYGSNVAIDAIVDSVSVKTTCQKQLAELGIIFCPISEAIRNHSELVQKYLYSVVPQSDNFLLLLILDKI